RNFTSMMRLDHNRALAQLAAKTGAAMSDIEGLAVWGNHSPTMYPDLHHATVAGKSALDLVDMAWLDSAFIPTVQKRGAAIIDARGASSAASAANAAIDHVRDWMSDTGGIVSMGVISDGSYGIAEGLFFSFPIRCAGGDWEVVQGLSVNDYSRAKLDITEGELREERELVGSLLP
ncbi:MAG: malate dehydrogenase, partial [Gammaproteobacteria bacterium]|nr:malate dehydrogenase [Gammaproteobacteria bacterium]